jgi:hypothetical protein
LLRLKRTQWQDSVGAGVVILGSTASPTPARLPIVARQINPVRTWPAEPFINRGQAPRPPLRRVSLSHTPPLKSDPLGSIKSIISRSIHPSSHSLHNKQDASQESCRCHRDNKEVCRRRPRSWLLQRLVWHRRQPPHPALALQARLPRSRNSADSFSQI